MSEDHLTRGFFRAILQGDRPPSDLVKVVMAHLFQLCPHCQAELEAFQKELEAVGEEVDYSSAYENTLARLLSHEEWLQREEYLAVQHLEEILRLSPEARLEEVQAAGERYRGPALAQRLLEASRRTLLDAPREAHALAQLARAVLQHYPTSPVVIELYGRALAHMANSLRVMGEVQAAAEYFDHARFLVRSHEAGDRLFFAELDQLEGSLRRDQRRLQEAAELLTRVVVTYREEDMPLEEARALLKLGMVFHEANDSDRAIAVTETALSRLEGLEQPRLWLMAHHNLAWLLQAAGRYEEAEELVVVSQGLYRDFPDAWTQLRLRWLKAHIARGLEDVETAEQRYVVVREGFFQQGMHYDAALVSLDLATLYLEQGRTGDVKRLAEEMVPIFEAQDVHREALAALMLFQDAARMEQLTLHFVRELSRYLQAARRNPELAFRKPS